MNSSVTAIVLAAGTGSRMKSDVKKQFIELEGKPLVWYALNQFDKSEVDEIVVVTGQEDIEYFKTEIVEKYNIKKVTKIVTGGSERYLSVLNGINVATGKYVLIHDGARALVDQTIIKRCLDSLEDSDASVVGVMAKDTIKLVGEDQIIEKTLPRERLFIAQTPQCFKTSVIKDAYSAMEQEKIDFVPTDDTSIVERFGNTRIRVVEGEYYNIKVTTPEDIQIAKKYLKKN